MIHIGKFYFGSKKRTVNQSLSKKLLFVLTFYCFYSSALAQNEILARIEFESAEELYVQEKYNEALKKIEKTESLLEKWTPKVSYLKIQLLRQLADFEDIYNNETISLLNETTVYFDFYKENPDDIILDKFKIVYEIDNELLFVKSVKPFKDTEEYIAWEKAIASDNITGLFMLAQIYLTGQNGLKKDKIKSQELMAMYNDLAKKRHDQFGNLFVFNRLIRQN